MSSITGRLLKGTLWVTFARAITNGLGMLSTIILAWNLAPFDFGLVAIAMTFVVILSSVTEISLSIFLIRHESPGESHLSAAWTLNALRGFLLFLLTCALAWPVSEFYSDNRLIPVLIILGFTLFISGLSNPRLAMAQRALQFWQDFIVSSGQKFIGFVAAVSTAIIFQSYWALVVGAFATQLANVILSYIVMPFRPRVVFQHFREIFSFSGWLTASQLVNTINFRAEDLIIGKMLGPSILGLYGMGANLAAMATRETTAPLKQIIYPAFANLRFDRERLRAAYVRSQALVVAVALPIGCGFAVVAMPLIDVVLSDRWSQAAIVVAALAPVFGIQNLGVLIQSVGMAQGENRIFFIRDLQLLLFRLPLIVFSAIYFGLIGVVCARVVSGILATALNLFLARRLLDIPVLTQIAQNKRAIVGTVIMCAATLGLLSVWPLPDGRFDAALRLAAIIPTGALIYSLVLGGMWFATGKPDGPESELLGIARGIGTKFKRPHS